MQRLTCVFLLCCLLIVQPMLSFAQTQKQAPLTNADILLLVTAGFSPELIVTKIRSTPGNFDTSITALQELKKANVPESVLMAMMGESVPADRAAAPPLSATPLSKQGVQPNGRFIVPAGTRVLLELAYTVSSDDMGVGDTLSFTTVHAVEVDDHVVVRRGAYATGRIVKAEAGKSWGRGGNIAWQISDVMATDGSRIPLQFASTTTDGKGKVGEMTTGMVITGLFFWPAIPFWGFKKGKGAVIPAGKRFDAIIDRDIELIEAPKLRSGDPRAYQEPVRFPNMLNRSAKEINESKTIFRKN